MITNRKFWLVAALAALAACDPYDKENKGALEILSAFGSVWSADDGAVASVSEGTQTAPNTFTITDVTAGTSVFYVKANKLLDGSKIQVNPSSCAPAPEVALTVNGAPANPDPANPTWFTCYYPGTSTASEGSSVVIYQGVDVQPLTGFFDSAALSSGFYTITATITDKQGNVQTVTINTGVAVTVFVDDAKVDVTTTSVHLSFDASGAEHPGATTFDLERAPNVVNANGDDEPGTWATIAPALPLTTASYDDTGLTPATSYWYRTILHSGGADTATSMIEVTTKTP